MLWRFVRRRLGSFPVRERALAEGILEQVEKAGRPLTALSDDELRTNGDELRKRARAGESLEGLLVPTFALVREVAARTVGMRPFDVQVMGAVGLHRACVAEMKTGEGKTLTAVLAVALNALAGQGVHVVTVNDYLAARDAAWMGPIYEFIGLRVGCVTEALDPEARREERKAAYAADITYVTNHELVFDYLRDNLALTPDEVVGRPLNYALVDEVDFLLLDEARTPLIISGPTGDEPDLCQEARAIVAPLQPGKHFRVEHKTRQISILEPGWAALEEATGVENLAAPDQLPWQHALHNALLAHGVYERDVDYILSDDGRVLIVDEFTGRVSQDKRYADGLHQALEAKEKLEVRPEDATLAKISYQTYFRLYPKLAGMTGTAYTEKQEFLTTYNLGVVPIPTHKEMIREDFEPIVYRSITEKLRATVLEIAELHQAGRPVLVGTVSVADSERLSALLDGEAIPHQVLNAKNHAREAEIVAQAGRPGAVTVSTNMAGRGTDIKLGGAEEDDADRERVLEAGGLMVIGTGLHDSERIDNQLRGRAGRQGDPGASIYFVSAEDPVYKKFGKHTLPDLMKRLANQPEDEPVVSRGVLAKLDELRDKVEVENRAIRTEVLKYDLVIETQRQTIYQWRRRLLGTGEDETHAVWDELVEDIGDDLVARHFEGEDVDLREAYDDFAGEVERRFDIEFDSEKELGSELDRSPSQAGERVVARLRERIAQLDTEIGRSIRLEVARTLLLGTIDELWTEHLGVLERLDEGIGLRGYGQLDPLIEYKKEAGPLFLELLRDIRLVAASRLVSVESVDEDAAPGTDDDNPFLPGEARHTRKSLRR